MRNIQIKIAACILFSQITFASEDSFFMTKEESHNILNFINSRGKNDKKEVENLKLSGIFYMDENNWTVWINNEAYSTIGQQTYFSIDEVSENNVSVTLQDGTTLCLSVSPNSSQDSNHEIQSAKDQETKKP